MAIPLNSATVRATLLQYQSGELPAAEAMRRLGLEWHGDLLRAMAVYELDPPLGGRLASTETLGLIDDLMAARNSVGGDAS